jgi:cysteine desulfuration protein SufE
VPLNESLQRWVEDLSVIPDPQERLAAIVDRARRSPPLRPVEKIAAHRVRGCVSVVWVVGEIREGRCYFRSDAESPVVRGLVAFLCECYSGAPPLVIAQSEADPLAALGLTQNLSPTRRNGLAATRAAIRAFAAQLAFGPPSCDAGS